jgi:hypothetical protein
VKFFSDKFGFLAEGLQEGFGSMERSLEITVMSFEASPREPTGTFRLVDRYGGISDKLNSVLEMQRGSAETKRQLLKQFIRGLER